MWSWAWFDVCNESSSTISFLVDPDLLRFSDNLDLSRLATLTDLNLVSLFLGSDVCLLEVVLPIPILNTTYSASLFVRKHNKQKELFGDGMWEKGDRFRQQMELFWWVWSFMITSSILPIFYYFFCLYDLRSSKKLIQNKTKKNNSWLVKGSACWDQASQQWSPSGNVYPCIELVWIVSKC